MSLTNATSPSLAYPEMLYSNAYNDRKNNFNNGNQSLPGVSEEQATFYRPNDPAPTAQDINKPDAPFAQPGQVVQIVPETENDDE